MILDSFEITKEKHNKSNDLVILLTFKIEFFPINWTKE